MLSDFLKRKSMSLMKTGIFISINCSLLNGLDFFYFYELVLDFHFILYSVYLDLLIISE